MQDSSQVSAFDGLKVSLESRLAESSKKVEVIDSEGRLHYAERSVDLRGDIQLC